MIKKFLAELFERIVNHKKYTATKKLLAQPRFKAGASSLYDTLFYYGDARTFYFGHQDIFKGEPYKFNTNLSDILIIDCGANIGLSPIYFKTLYPQAKVIAFEPDPAIFKTMEKNVAVRKLTNMELVNKAIWINNDVIEFEVEGGFSGRINKYNGEENLIKVPAQRLKDLLTQNVAFLKIDIEGAEYEVLKDCAENLHFVEHLFIEYHSHISEPQKLGELLTILSNANFRYHIKEAYTVTHPFTDNGTMVGMDLQLNIYAKNQKAF